MMTLRFGIAYLGRVFCKTLALPDLEIAESLATLFSTGRIPRFSELMIICTKGVLIFMNGFCYIYLKLIQTWSFALFAIRGNFI